MKPASEFTPQEAAEWAAEKVMGWRPDDPRVKGYFPGVWSPLTDANDSLTMLAAWRATAPDGYRRTYRHYADDDGHHVSVYERDVWHAAWWHAATDDVFTNAAFVAIYQAEEGTP